MHDVIIIGAGPAGLTAAIYCGRFKLRTKIIEKSQIGGQLNLTNDIENFPAVFKARSKDLVEAMSKQVKELDSVEVDEFKEVTKIRHGKTSITVEVKSLVDEKDDTYECRSLIVASGAQPKKIGIDGEERFTGKGVSYCAVCDAPFFKDKDIILIGGGDAALEEALYLTKYARKVMIVHRRDKLRATKILQERSRNNSEIEFILSSMVMEILGKDSVDGVRIKDMKTNNERKLNCSGVFVFAGYAPNTKFVNDLLELNEEHYIITNEEMATNKNGIFACGDCRKRPLKQIVTACGEGAVAANSAEKYLQGGA